MVEEAAALYHRPIAQLSVTEIQRLWSLLGEFGARLAPATIEGLRLTANPANIPQLPGGLKIGVIITLFVTLALHAHVLFGIETISSIDSRSQEQLSVYDEMSRMTEANPGLLGVDCNKAVDASSATSAAGLVGYLQLCRKAQAIDVAKANDYRSLYQWSAPWGAVIAWLNFDSLTDYWGCECVNTSGACPSACAGTQGPDASRPVLPRDYQVRYGSEALARGLLGNLQALVLPMLYSLLGAGVWVLRNHYEQVREHRLRPGLAGYEWQRIMLGAILGGITGALYTDEEIRRQMASIPLFGLAFLIGYNVELVFSLIDRIVGIARDRLAAIGRPPQDQPPMALSTQASTPTTDAGNTDAGNTEGEKVNAEKAARAGAEKTEAEKAAKAGAEKTEAERMEAHNTVSDDHAKS
jgi:hypothetical protein